MKVEPSVKYPYSANLFQFCRKVLDRKFGGIRVIDQDVGQILGFDPADCSHWKKGKKNIKSIHAMKQIAEHLGVDEALVIDVACGEISNIEALHEFHGYGSFTLDNKLVDKAKKEFYKTNANQWSNQKDSQINRVLNLNNSIIDEIVAGIHEKINFKEAPLYLPEIVSHFPSLVLKPIEKPQDDGMNQLVTVLENANNLTEIEFPRETKMRPYLRFQIAKALTTHFFKNTELEDLSEFGPITTQIRNIQANLFAAKLLTPAHLIKKELAMVNIAKDIISQLAEVFWVSKIFINIRLKDILINSPTL